MEAIAAARHSRAAIGHSADTVALPADSGVLRAVLAKAARSIPHRTQESTEEPSEAYLAVVSPEDFRLVAAPVSGAVAEDILAEVGTAVAVDTVAEVDAANARIAAPVQNQAEHVITRGGQYDVSR